jgi:cell shape-determining protein MreD
VRPWHVVAAVAGLNYLLYLALAEVSHLLSRWALGLHFESLLILFPALFLPAGQGLVLCLLFALLLGVHAPVPLGMTLLTFCLLWNLAGRMRSRLRREHPGHLAGLGAFLQALQVLGWSFAFASLQAAPAAFWWRATAELLVSAALVALLAGWWCRWQYRLLDEFGWQPEKV